MISEELEISIQNAFEMAKLKKHEFLTLEHLMLELCKDDEIKALFKFYKVNEKKVKSDLEQFIEKKLKDIVMVDESRPMPSAAFERVLKRAAQHVQSLDVLYTQLKLGKHFFEDTRCENRFVSRLEMRIFQKNFCMF